MSASGTHGVSLEFSYKGFKKGVTMTKPERNPEFFEHRPFSRFHRNELAEHCLATDLDFIEYRRGRGIVAILEIKAKGILNYFQRSVFTELSKRARVPFYFIRHNKGMNKFRVTKVDRLQVYDKKIEPFPMTQEQFKKFMETL